MSGVKSVGEEPDERRVSSRAVRAVRDLAFRPALYGNRTRTRDHVELRYQILDESD